MSEIRAQEVEGNKTVLVTNTGSDQVTLVVAIVLSPEDLDIERILSGLVPEMARGGVRGGLLVVGDSTLVLRNDRREVLVDEVSTASLLGMVDIDEPWSPESIVEMMQRWIAVLASEWRDRVVGSLREILVPNIVAGLAGEVQVVDGIWGLTSHRLASEVEV